MRVAAEKVQVVWLFTKLSEFLNRKKK